MAFKQEDDVRAYVKRLANFYKQLTMYGVVNAGLILTWLLGGEGYFWPIWCILGWGIPLFFVAVDLHLLPKGVQHAMNSFMETLPFLRPEWESEQIDRIIKKGAKKEAGKASPATTASSSSKTLKKSVSSEKKGDSKKTGVKKAVVKKAVKGKSKKTVG